MHAAGSDRPLRAPRAYWLLWTATLLFFAAFYSLLVPLPLYMTAAGLSDTEIGVVLGAFGFASLALRLPAGWAADRFGLRPLLLLGAGLLLAGALLVPLTDDVVLLFLLRAAQAAGYVVFTTSGTAAILRMTPPAVRGSRIALFGAAANVAMTLIPAATTAALVGLPREAPFLTAAGFALLAGLLGVSAAGAVGRATAAAVPRLSAALLQRLALPMLSAALAGAGFAAFFQFVPLLAERREGVTAGLLYTVYGVSIIAARLITGRLVDRWSLQRSLAVSAALMTAGLLLFSRDLGAFAPIAAALIAFGSGFSHPVLIAMHARLVPNAPGTATAVFYLGFDLGVGLSSLLYGRLLDLGGLSALYLAAAALTLLLLLGAPLLQRRVLRDEAADTARPG